MESNRVQHILHPLTDGWFIDEVEINRGSDFWLGRNVSEQRTFLADKYDVALRLAREKIKCHHNK